MSKITRKIVRIAVISAALSGVNVIPTFAASDGSTESLVGAMSTTSAAVQIINSDVWETDKTLEEDSNVKINNIMFTVVDSDKKYARVEGSKDRTITSITLPSKIKCAGITYTVTAIENNAFYFHENLKSIEIPNTVTEIGNYAFWHCKKLENLNIPDSVTTIGLCTFENCESLKSIKIPSNVKSIGPYPFIDCYSLTQITVDEDNQYYKSIDGILFNKECTTILKYPEAKADRDYVIIPNGVTTIVNGAFNECENITIEVPKSVTTIGEYAFENTEHSYYRVYDENTKSILLSSGNHLSPKSIIIIGSESDNAKPSRDKLENLYNTYKNIPQRNYKPSTWNSFIIELRNSEILLNKTYAPLEELNKSYNYLNSAIKGLKTKSSSSSSSKSSGSSLSSTSSNEVITNTSIQALESSIESNAEIKVIVSALGGNVKGIESTTTQNGNKVDIITVNMKNNQSVKIINAKASDKISLQLGENYKVYVYIEKLGAYMQVDSQVADDKISFNVDSKHTYIVGNENIELKTIKEGWNKFNGLWYVLNKDGGTVTGWYKDYGKWYYLSNAGVMVTDWLKDIDGKWYYLQGNGSMAYDTYVNGYYLGSSGAWVK